MTDAVIDPLAMVVEVLLQGEGKASGIRPSSQLPLPQTTQPFWSLTLTLLQQIPAIHL